MKKLFGIFFLAIVLWACSKEEESSSSNPFNDPSLNPPPDTTTPLNLDSSSFQFLYYKVFNPTCANSGCHDGNFQPDFRTIYSSYNTLVQHSVIQNDVQETFKYRVEPFNVGKSLLHERLNRFMVNTSGVMPLAVDADSEWLTDSATFKKLINNWILKGAPDTYGNLPGSANLKPQVIGVLAFNSGSTTTPLPGSGSGTISIPEASPIDVWFAFNDDATDVANFKMSDLKSSYLVYDFSNAIDHNLSSGSTISGKDFWDNTVTFTHKTTLSFPTDTIGTYVYLRTYLRDDVQEDTTEIPNTGSSNIMRSYFSLKVDSL